VNSHGTRQKQGGDVTVQYRYRQDNQAIELQLLWICKNPNLAAKHTMNKVSNKVTQLVVISAVGTDRTGVVNDLSKVILDCGGNIEESRMTALGSEFAMLLLVSGNWAAIGKLEKALGKLSEDQPLSISLRKTDERVTDIERMPYGIDIVSLDQPGIVFSLASFFAAQGIEIADLTTRRYAAAHTGSQMFAVQMTVNVPSSTSISQLRDEFLELCDQLNLDAILEPVKA
jgi:glycine cleavage system transcriptional repressor